MHPRVFLAVALLIAITRPGTSLADTFGVGVNQFAIDFVPIGQPFNAPDTIGRPNPAGQVNYAYRMGKFEISRGMIEKANALGNLQLELNDMSFVAGGPRSDMPATGVTWDEAARFVNWLNVSSGFPPAYKFAIQPGEAGYHPYHQGILLWDSSDPGFNPANPFRNRQARYVIPGVHEWYKAAYYNPLTSTYSISPLGSDAAPTPVVSGTSPGTAVFSQQNDDAGPADITQAGGLSFYLTMAQGGNVNELGEGNFEPNDWKPASFRGVRGGGWDASSLHPTTRGAVISYGDNPYTGFRVASVPEPTALGLAIAALPLLRRKPRPVVAGRSARANDVDG